MANTKVGYNVYKSGRKW